MGVSSIKIHIGVFCKFIYPRNKIIITDISTIFVDFKKCLNGGWNWLFLYLFQLINSIRFFFPLKVFIIF